MRTQGIQRMKREHDSWSKDRWGIHCKSGMHMGCHDKQVLEGKEVCSAWKSKWSYRVYDTSGHCCDYQEAREQMTCSTKIHAEVTPAKKHSHPTRVRLCERNLRKRQHTTPVAEQQSQLTKTSLASSMEKREQCRGGGGSEYWNTQNNKVHSGPCGKWAFRDYDPFPSTTSEDAHNRNDQHTPQPLVYQCTHIHRKKPAHRTKLSSA